MTEEINYSDYILLVEGSLSKPNIKTCVLHIHSFEESKAEGGYPYYIFLHVSKVEK